MATNLRRSATQWSELISEYRGSGETERQFCQRRGINFHSFRKWKYRQNTTKANSKVAAPRRSFVEVRPIPRSTKPLRIQLGEELSIECPSEMAIEEVARLVGALRDGR